MIIPIGIDCGLASFLRDNKLRSMSLPFDWVVTYNGVADIIKNDFINYIPTNNKMNEIYNVAFIHNDFPSDSLKMLERINRFINILKTSNEKIYFIRKGHAQYHHKECNYTKNDLEDCIEFDKILKIKYPKLEYEIVVMLICNKCFHKDVLYESTSKHINILNSTQTNDIIDDTVFIKLYNWIHLKEL
jgi:hypothetical protein